MAFEGLFNKNRGIQPLPKKQTIEPTKKFEGLFGKYEAEPPEKPKVEEKPVSFLSKTTQKMQQYWPNYLASSLLETSFKFLGGDVEDVKWFIGGKETSLVDKMKYFAESVPESIKEVGKSWAKAPLRVAATIVEPWIRTAYGLEATEEKPIDFPGLGEVPTLFYSYKQLRKGGLSPFEAGLTAGSQTAMDLAISAGMVDYFTGKIPVKVGKGELVPEAPAVKGAKGVYKVKTTPKMSFGKPLKDTVPDVSKISYWRLGKNAMLEIVPTKQGTIKLTAYNISRSRFQNLVNNIGKTLKNVGITYIKKAPEIRSLAIPPAVIPTPAPIVPPTPPVKPIQLPASKISMVGELSKTLDKIKDVKIESHRAEFRTQMKRLGFKDEQITNMIKEAEKPTPAPKPVEKPIEEVPVEVPPAPEKPALELKGMKPEEEIIWVGVNR